MPATEHTTWTVAIIAKLPPGVSPIDQQRVAAVTLRRDPPLGSAGAQRARDARSSRSSRSARGARGARRWPGADG